MIASRHLDRRDAFKLVAARCEPATYPAARAERGRRGVPRSGQGVVVRPGRSGKQARQRPSPSCCRARSPVLRQGKLGLGPSSLAEYPSFDSTWQQLAFNEHRRTIEDRLEQWTDWKPALHEAVVSWRFYPVVLALQAMRGIQFTSAVD